MKLGDLKNVETVLKKVVNTALPIKIAYLLSKCLPKMDQELTILEKMRIKLVNQYGVKGDGDQITVTKEKLPAFLKEYNGLLDVDVDIEMPSISIDVLEKANVKLTPIEVESLVKIGLIDEKMMLNG
jgi:hypothetical protein